MKQAANMIEEFHLQYGRGGGRGDRLFRYQLLLQGNFKGKLWMYAAAIQKQEKQGQPVKRKGEDYLWNGRENGLDLLRVWGCLPCVCQGI